MTMITNEMATKTLSPQRGQTTVFQAFLRALRQVGSWRFHKQNNSDKLEKAIRINAYREEARRRVDRLLY